MSAVMSDRIDRGRRDAPRKHRWALALVVLLFGVLAFVAVRGSHKLERDALSRMDSSDRRALYDATLRSAEALCARAAAEPVFSERCIAQTNFLLRFPECDAACVELARRHRPQPTR